MTRVGREQLRLTGERLREMRVSYSRMVASTMKRAQESAEIILKCIGWAMVWEEETDRQRETEI